MTPYDYAHDTLTSFLTANPHKATLPIPVLDIAAWMHAYVAPCEGSGSGAIEYEPLTAAPTLRFNWNRSRTFQRFTVAHLIGHVVMHKDLGAHREPTQGPFDPIEKQANQFAAGLLMPEAWVRKHAVETGAQPAVLAAIYGVSIEAMTFRLRKLGLL